MRECPSCWQSRPASDFIAKYKQCKECRLELSRHWRAVNDGVLPPEPRYPVDDLLKALEVQRGKYGDNRNGNAATNWKADLAATLHLNRKTLDKWLQRKTLSWKQADEAAVHAGLHPRDVWAQWR